MTLSRARLDKINLYNYLKHEVLGLEFVEQYESESLSYDSTVGLYRPDYSEMFPNPVSPGRGWVMFDEVSNQIDVSSEQTSRISVTGASTYDVNYALGGVSNPSSTPTSVDFYYHYVSVLDGWPSITPPHLPIVAVDQEGQRRAGFQLGPGYVSSREVDVHIFATSSAEKDDLTEAVFDAVYNRSIPVVDFSAGDIMTPRGFYDSSFVRTTVSEASVLFFDDVVQRSISSPADWSDLNKYRSVISFTMMTYKG